MAPLGTVLQLRAMRTAKLQAYGAPPVATTFSPSTMRVAYLLLHVAAALLQMHLRGLRAAAPRVEIAAARRGPFAPRASHLRYLAHMVAITLVAVSALASWRLGAQDIPTVPVRSQPSPISHSVSREDLLVAPALPSPPTIRESPVSTAVLPAVAQGDVQTRDVGSPGPAPGTQPAGEVSKGRPPLKYAVQRGDTVSGIAQKFGISTDTVLGANDLWDADSIQVGEELVILPVSGVLHTVMAGDSVQSIAVGYGVSTQSIVEFNGLPNPNAIQIGEELVVPGGQIRIARASPSSRGGSRAAAGPTGSFRWPVRGGITQGYSPSHRGIDIAAQQGVPVYAADGGTVVKALKVNYDYGWHLILDHGNGYQSLYGHLSAFMVDYGERVAPGDRIGSVGSTGLSTGPHLHFEIWQNGSKLNPLKLLP